MAYLQWTSNLSVGNATLDSHHKILVDLINAVSEAKGTSGQARVNLALTELLDYTRYHFTEEERVMEAAGYPELDQHRQSHAEMVRQVADLRNRHLAGTAVLSAEHLLDYLSQWLMGHIVAKDLRFRPYVE